MGHGNRNESNDDNLFFSNYLLVNRRSDADRKEEKKKTSVLCRNGFCLIGCFAFVFILYFYANQLLFSWQIRPYKPPFSLSLTHRDTREEWTKNGEGGKERTVGCEVATNPNIMPGLWKRKIEKKSFYHLFVMSCSRNCPFLCRFYWKN